MIPVLFWAFAALVLVSLTVTIVIGRHGRGDERATTGQECSEMDEQLSAGPVPYWPAEHLEALVTAITCGRCRPLGYGPCWCRTDCGHGFCWGTGTLRWLPEDDDIIEGKRAL